MPANLTADFIKARKRFRQAKDPDEKLSALEEMLTTIPKHKGTDKMQADIKRRIAKLKESQSQGKHGGKATGYDHIPREGAGQVALIGPPNTGKSSLLTAVTNARPEIAEYPFSTLVPIPGMMAFEDVSIQLLDLPPITPEYTESWVYGLIRGCDVGLVVLDASDGELILDELEEVRGLLVEKHLQLVAERGGEADERIVEIPTQIVLNKVDLVSGDGVDSLITRVPFPTLRVSTATGHGIDELRKRVFEALHVVRIYTKMPGKKPDMTEPYTLPCGSTALDAVKTVHREFTEKLKYVRVWGSGRFDGQQVPSDHVLEDGDIIEIHLR
jgi:ribosome-interacting GTPase 1